MNASLRHSRVAASTAVVASQLETTRGMEPGTVEVVPLGVDAATFRGELKSAVNKDGTTYFFHLASRDPRDHTELVIKAFGAFLDCLQTAPNHGIPLLIVAGRLGDRDIACRRLARAVAQDRVRFLGWVSDVELARLYSGALATVDASVDEGFGLQPLEALACGSLLISTGSPSVREVVAGAEVIWSGLEVRELAGSLSDAYSSPERRLRAATTNPAVASKFSWDDSARRIHDLLTDLALTGPQ